MEKSIITCKNKNKNNIRSAKCLVTKISTKHHEIPKQPQNNQLKPPPTGSKPFQDHVPIIPNSLSFISEFRSPICFPSHHHPPKRKWTERKLPHVAAGWLPYHISEAYNWCRWRCWLPATRQQRRIVASSADSGKSLWIFCLACLRPGWSQVCSAADCHNRLLVVWLCTEAEKTMTTPRHAIRNATSLGLAIAMELVDEKAYSSLFRDFVVFLVLCERAKMTRTHGIGNPCNY